MTTNASTISPPSDVMAFLSLSTLGVHSETQSVSSNASQPFTSGDLPITVCLAYVSEDNEFKDRIKGELDTLQLQKYPIKDCVLYDINHVKELFTDIKAIDAYQLFLFLLSPDFVRHRFCYSDEVKKLIEKHRDGKWVSPILLRKCQWEGTPFGPENRELPVLPHPQRPVTRWQDRDEAYWEITEGIKTAIAYLKRGCI